VPLFFDVFIFRVIKAGKTQEQSTSKIQPEVKEKEIIREIVKIGYPYC
jgi:hypothetical protein